MTWAGRRVLVTGAGGFVGSHLVEGLLRAGADVTAFVRYTSRGGIGMLALTDDDIRSQVNVVMGDLRDPQAVRVAAAQQDVIFHLGALIAIPYSYVHPIEVADVNVMGTVNVLDAARVAQVSRVVHTSTSETYGTALRVPIDESHPSQAQSPYAATKIGADALASAYGASFGLAVATIRPFNTYGPRQSGRAVIPTIIGQALYGERVELGSLASTRDFTFVSDLVEGFLAVGAEDEAVGRVCNIGSGKEIAIGELAERIIARVGRDVPIETNDARLRPEASEVDRLVCDASLAKRLLGWEPTVSLEEGLDRVIEFLRANPGWTDPDRYEV